jgi:hypothetical protein
MGTVTAARRLGSRFFGSGSLTQVELYRLGALTTLFYVLVFLLVGTVWLLLVTPSGHLF